MPVVRVEWHEGHSSEDKKKVANFIADTISQADKISKDRVMVMFTDYAGDSISKGGKFSEDK